MVFYATCNGHSLRRHEKAAVNDGILLSAAAATAAAIVPHHKRLHRAATIAATA